MTNFLNFAHNPLEQFEILDFLFLAAPLWNNQEGFKLSLTNIGFYLLIVLAVVLAFNLLTNNNGRVIANRWSIAHEGAFGSILTMVRDQIGPSNEVYVPFLYSLFSFILFSNLVGMVPYSFTPTSHLVLACSMSFTILIGVTILGLLRHGLKFFGLFIPSGTPLGLVPVLVIIETVSYVARLFSLGIRLGANMIAGHCLLKIISTFTWKIIIGSSIGIILGILPILFLTALSALELAIAFLQAYVFTILTCTYIRDGINLH